MDPYAHDLRGTYYDDYPWQALIILIYCIILLLISVPGARTAKLSTSTSPFTDLSSTNQDESSVFYPGADSSPAAAVPGPSPTSEPLDMYSELYNDLHNKLNWLTVSFLLSSLERKCRYDMICFLMLVKISRFHNSLHPEEREAR